MSKKSKNAEIEGIGPVTLSALTVGWLEEYADLLAEASNDTKSAVRASVAVVHGALRKHHPDITKETLLNTLTVTEATQLSGEILVLSGLAMGGAAPGNQSQATSSET